jgi:ABC-type transporter lipoprotein component MlaA/pimeloyl-ACP methyl ester carboxylesterase
MKVFFDFSLPKSPARQAHVERSISNMKLKYRLPYFVVLVCFLVNAPRAQSAASTPAGAPPGLATVAATNLTDPNAIVLPQPLHDPLERFNRAVWGLNKGLMTSVIKPVSAGYRFVVPKPVRKGVGNAGRNLTYPGRFINEGLQGDPKAMCDETERCLCNTIFGVGGFFDVATYWHIPKRDADFGQTFKKWGFQPGIYLMLPLLGPSDIRDGVGLGADYGANPLSYFFPYEYIGSAVTANNLSDSVDEYVRFSQTQADPYSILQYAWTFTHVNRSADLRLIGDQDPASLETLESFFFSYKNPGFLDRGKTRSVFIPATGKKLDFTFWLQPGRAPIVYLIPGFGAHRLAENELALAELLVSNKFSVVTVSSTFHPEFMERASTSDLPAYPPLDVDDLQHVLTEIDRHLDADYPHRLGSRALMGYSMGAFQSLFLAATTATNPAPPIKFQRYVAIDSPVRLRYAATNLDQFYRAPLAWPAEERTANIENIFLKVAALATQPPAPVSSLPFNAIESRFLIGLSFRLGMRDIIFSSQLRHNQGILQLPLKRSSRRAVYNEILKFSFRDYIDKFATPYDKTRGIDITDPDVLKRGTDLTTYTAELRANPDIRLVLNRNDIFLAESDVEWVESTFAPARRTLFSDGGHLGNLSQPAVQQAILHALDGLKQTAGK